MISNPVHGEVYIYVLETTLCDKVCQWFATGQWFSPGTPVSFTNKTDRHDITEILLKVVLNTINHSKIKCWMKCNISTTGDYSPAGGTLIGALMRNLGIRVNQLAKDKEMDLRTNFSCWMSKELDKNLPYKRLLCFERYV